MRRVCSILLPAALLVLPVMSTAEEAVEIGARRELLVDRHLVEELSGGARQVLHHPAAQEVAITFDAPWEGSGCGYHNVFRDGDVYRMFYRGGHLEVRENKLRWPHPHFLCYAESADGIHWKKPNLGLVEFEGSKENNIVLGPGRAGHPAADHGHIAVFKDANPDCAAEAKYKAIARSRGPKGLLALRSPDAIHWEPMAEEPVITDGAFDSQNLACWDPVRGEYRAYWRDFREGRRDIKTAVSKDFVHWSEPEWLAYPGAPKEQLYTNQIKPYYRAPHLLLGLPTRYVDRGWTPSAEKLPDAENRRQRATGQRRYGTALTETLLMTSRDGRRFHRWPEAFIRPGPERPGSWAYGDTYTAWQIVETASHIEAAPPVLSLYASEGYWTGKSSRLRRYTLRIDGFASIQAPLAGGELVTKPLTFDGDRLELNFSTSAAGSVQVEIQDAEGKPLEGYGLADCPAMYGDSLGREVPWKGGAEVAKLSGRPVRLRFVLKDADLYAFRFGGEE